VKTACRGGDCLRKGEEYYYKVKKGFKTRTCAAQHGQRVHEQDELVGRVDAHMEEASEGG
jgi:hypothetical protein